LLNMSENIIRHALKPIILEAMSYFFSLLSENIIRHALKPIILEAMSYFFSLFAFISTLTSLSSLNHHVLNEFLYLEAVCDQSTPSLEPQISRFTLRT